MFAAILIMAVAGLPQSTLRLPQSTLAFNPAGSPGPVAAERWEWNTAYGYAGRHVGGRLVGGWFPRWNAYVPYDDAARAWGYSYDGPRPPVAAAPAPAPVFFPRLRQVCGPNGCQLVPW